MRSSKRGSEDPSRAVSPLVRTNAALLLVATSAACVALLAFRRELAGEARYLFMLWNLFLAWLPYAAAVAAGLAVRASPGRVLSGAAVLGLGALWLLFLPNCMYLVTDFIHLIAGRNRYVTDGAFGYLVWFDLVLFFLFAWAGILLGYLSMFRFHRLAAVRFGTVAGWAFVAVVSGLNGYGVFLGRIVRLNSWDAWMRPAALIEDVLHNLHVRGIAFSLLFGALTFATYVTLYHLQEGKR